MPGHRACARDFAPAAITDRGGRAKYELVEPGVAECRDQAGAAIAKAGAPGSICEFALRMKNARFVLHRADVAVLRRLLVPDEGLRQTVSPSFHSKG